MSGRPELFRRLGLIALVALALRVVYLLVLAPPAVRAIDDTFWYAFVSEQIVLGHSFTISHQALFTPGFHVDPTAVHPPLYPLALAGLRELGLSTNHLLWLGPVTETMTVVGLGFSAGLWRVPEWGSPRPGSPRSTRY